MIRPTYGREVDEALALLDVAGVPREAVATIRARLRRDKRVVAAALGLCQAIDFRLPPETWGAAFMARFGELDEAVAALRSREEARV